VDLHIRATRANEIGPEPDDVAPVIQEATFRSGAGRRGAWAFGTAGRSRALSGPRACIRLRGVGANGYEHGMAERAWVGGKYKKGLGRVSERNGNEAGSTQ